MIVKINHPKSNTRFSHYLDDNLNLKKGDQVKIIKGKDRSKRGCAVLTLHDKLIGFIPNPEREILWEKLDANPALQVSAEIVDYDCQITHVRPWGPTAESCKSYDIEGPKTSITISIKFTNQLVTSDVFLVNLVGFKYITPLPELKEGDKIKIMHENDNSHDKLALKVLKEVNQIDTKIGYIPTNFFAREDLISKLMLKNEIFGCIKKIKKNGKDIKYIELLIQK